MKAIYCTKYGGPETLHLVNIPTPKPKADEVLIEIKATAVNAADVRVRGLKVEGFMKLIMRLVLGFNKPRKPILGVVYAGIITEKGNKVTQWNVGDEVFGMTGFRFGTYAAYTTVKANSAIALKPNNASFEEAVSLIFGGTTAHYFLNKAQIQDTNKNNILIYGASGSVGVAAIQMAKYHKKNITTVSSIANFDLCKSLGATLCYDYQKTPIQQISGSFDIIFDAVGKIKAKDVVHLLSKNGKFVTVDSLDVASESVEQLLFWKKLFETNQINAVIDQTFTLENIVAAHEYVDSERKKGNVVISL